MTVAAGRVAADNHPVRPRATIITAIKAPREDTQTWTFVLWLITTIDDKGWLVIQVSPEAFRKHNRKTGPGNG
jgi:hypothetical protein